jgi:hypothetical protein
MNTPRPIDYAAVKRLATIGCTDREIAIVTDFCFEWICKRKKTDTKLADAIEKGRAEGKTTLRRMQWQAAAKGNPTMLIWLGKQMLDQRDKNELTGKDGAPLKTVIGLSDETVDEIRRKVLGIEKSNAPTSDKQ